MRKGFRARLQNHPRGCSALEERAEAIRPPPPLTDNRPVSRADADLTLFAPEVDADVLHLSAPSQPSIGDRYRGRPLHPF
jgi:hypothetical protein